MKPHVLVSSVLLASTASPVTAQVAIGSFAGSDVGFEGVVMADAHWYDSDVADRDGDPQDDADHAVRTARFVLKGKGPGRFDWILSYDARNERWLDANARYKFGAKGGQFVQVGQYKQPNGLLAAPKHDEFMSQAMIINTFAVGRRLGAAYTYGYPDEHPGGDGPANRHGEWGITAGYFGREMTAGFGRGSGYGARATWAPWHAKRRILHFGLSYVDYDTPADTVRLRARPNADLTDVRLVDTGSLADAGRIAAAGVESVWVHGPFKVQGEYMAARVDRYGSQDFSGAGGYVSGAWNLTGESWDYVDGEPALLAGPATGMGMWQVTVRYDVLDLDDGAVRGGRMENWTLGVNWYWRSHLKFVLNYVRVRSERGGIEDDPDIVEARAQFHW